MLDFSERSVTSPLISSKAESIAYTINTRKLLIVVFVSCLAIQCLLVLLDATVNYQRWSKISAIRRLFNITREDGLASWFAITQTFVVTLVLWTIFLTVRKLSTSTRQRLGWLTLALFFTYMTIDDGAKIHERLGTAFKATHGEAASALSGDIIGARALDSYPSYGWQILFAPFLGGMALFILYFLWREMPRRIDQARIVIALACFAIAVGLDFVEGLDSGYESLVSGFQLKENTIRHFSKSLEEFLEMLGTTIFLVAFLGYLAHLSNLFSIRLSNPPP